MIPVSIVIPTLNVTSCLKSTLDGFTLQTYPASEFEIIISDDGSSDGIEELVEEYKRRLPLRLLRHPVKRRNIQLSSVRNRGILSAEGDVIISVDADCIPTPDMIWQHVQHFLQLTEQIVVIGLRRFVNSRQVEKSIADNDWFGLFNLSSIASESNFGFFIDRRIPELKYFDKHPMPYNCFHTCNVSFLKKEALAAGLFDTDFDGNWGYEDIEFGYRMWYRGARFIIENAAMVLHQEDGGHTLAQRLHGKTVNFPLACKKIPGFEAFRNHLGR